MNKSTNCNKKKTEKNPSAQTSPAYSPQKAHRISTVQPPVDRRQSVEDILQLNTSRHLTEQAFNFLVNAGLNMYYCGKQTAVYNHRYGPAIRDHYLLVFINEGHGRLETNDKFFELNANNLLVMFPNNKVFYKVDRDTPWTIQWLGLYGKLVDEYMDMLGINPGSPVFPVANADEIRNIMELIYRKSSEEDVASKIDCISLLHRFFACLAENEQVRSRKSPFRTGYVEQSVNYMKYNYEHGISSADVADNLKIDRSYFAKIFRQETGTTPTRWLVNLRVNKARRLLESTGLTVGEVAYSVGIFDQFYFSRLFKAETGMSPLEYRKSEESDHADTINPSKSYENN
ncbi:MAG: AraC family transcriptional regulator [Eubacteriales bacterium]|nr:AraC family transcriptional regulator [Eubacteriales bacterium]